MPQRLTKLVKLASPKPVSPASRFLPTETTRKARTHIFSLPLPLDDTGAFPCGPSWQGSPPPLGICEYNKLSFQW